MVEGEGRGAGKGLSLTAWRQGVLPEGEEGFFHFPGGENLILRAVSPLPGGSLFDLNIKGLPRERIKAGDLLIPCSLVPGKGRKALFLWRKRGGFRGSFLEITLRDTPGIKGVAGEIREKNGYCIFMAKEPFLQIPGQLYSFCPSGGQGGQGAVEALLVMGEPWTPEQEKKMAGRMKKIRNFPGEEGVFSMNLRVRGAVRLPSRLKNLSFEGAVACGSWRIMSRIYEKFLSLVERRSRAEQGLAEKELPRLSGLPGDLCRDIVAALKAEGRIFRAEGFLFNAAGEAVPCLSPMSRKALEELGAAGAAGLPLKEWRLPQKSLEALRRRGLIYVYSGFAIEKQALLAQGEELFRLLPRDRNFSLPDIKGLLSLSRNRLLLLLEVLEKEGRLEREGQVRRVCRFSGKDEGR